MIYTGKGLLIEQNLSATDKHTADKLYPYLPDEELVKAVNLALLLKRPLLLMGEPGCGKTRVAEALAYELYHREGDQDFRDSYYKWFVKSVSKVRDGQYEYDMLERLRDAQPGGKLKEDEAYVRYRDMGLAFQNSVKGHPTVLLIDEIDKADIDFPNDLLNELDKATFQVPEIRKEIKAAEKPIIIITSNQEKPLPDAFLRRCIYHFITPFDEQRLRDIVVKRFYPNATPDNELLDRAIKTFLTVRSKIAASKTAGKNVSTSELLDWFEALQHYKKGLPTDDAATELNIAQIELKKYLDTDGSDLKSLPLRQALLKNYETLLEFEKG